MTSLLLKPDEQLAPRSGQSCKEGSKQLPAPTGADRYRAQLYAELYEAWPQRAAALDMCGSFAHRMECGDCASPVLVPFRCLARTCPTCARLSAAVLVDRVAPRLAAWEAAGGVEGAPTAGMPWDGHGEAKARRWRTVVLTTANPRAGAEEWDRAELRRDVKRVRAAWSKLWRLSPWGRQVATVRENGRRAKRARLDTAAVIGLEVAPGGMVHIHALVYGEDVPQAELRRLWQRALGADYLPGVRVERLRRAPGAEGAAALREALTEVLKYSAKGEKGARRIQRAAAVELALRAVRRVEVLGALRRAEYGAGADVAASAADVAQLEARELAGADAQRPGKCCPVCEGTRFVWTSLRGRELVAMNGGFGPLNVPHWHDRGSGRWEALHRADLPPWWEADASVPHGAEWWAEVEAMRAADAAQLRDVADVAEAEYRAARGPMLRPEPTTDEERAQRAVQAWEEEQASAAAAAWNAMRNEQVAREADERRWMRAVHEQGEL